MFDSAERCNESAALISSNFAAATAASDSAMMYCTRGESARVPPDNNVLLGASVTVSSMARRATPRTTEVAPGKTRVGMKPRYSGRSIKAGGSRAATRSSGMNASGTTTSLLPDPRIPVTFQVCSIVNCPRWTANSRTSGPPAALMQGSPFSVTTPTAINQSAKPMPVTIGIRPERR